MKILPPVSIEARRLLPSRWDLLAAVLVLGFIVAFADASRFLIQPISSRLPVATPSNAPFAARWHSASSTPGMRTRSMECLWSATVLHMASRMAFVCSSSTAGGIPAC